MGSFTKLNKQCSGMIHISIDYKHSGKALKILLGHVFCLQNNLLSLSHLHTFLHPFLHRQHRMKFASHVGFKFCQTRSPLEMVQIFCILHIQHKMGIFHPQQSDHNLQEAPLPPLGNEILTQPLKMGANITKILEAQGGEFVFVLFICLFSLSQILRR